MKKNCWQLFLLLLLIGLAGCSRGTDQNLPSAVPTEYLPTAIALTVAAGQATVTTFLSPPPSITPTPEASGVTATPLPRYTATSRPTLTPTLRPVTPTATRRPTRTPTITKTPGIPDASVQFYNPGPMSKVVSPLHFSASLVPGSSGRVQIELWGEPLHPGEEGRLLYRKILVYSPSVDGRVVIADDVEFELSGVSEIARLQISTEDSQGRMVALSSVNLILLAMGNTDINPSDDSLEPIIVREPLPKILIQGGNVLASGLVRIPDGQILLVELVAAGGKVVGYRQAMVSAPGEGGYAAFAATVPYSVTAPTWVRLTLSIRGDRIPGVTHLSSIEVLLSP